LRIYEGMFVVDDARWSENQDAVMREVRGLLDKNRAQVFTCEKWDDRKLAYPIKGRSRGIYILTRFTAPTDALRTLERDAQLNETILRVLITRDLRSEQLDKAGLFPPKPEAPPAATPAPTEAVATGAPSGAQPPAAGPAPANPRPDAQ